jgi:hypothetical protein
VSAPAGNRPLIALGAASELGTRAAGGIEIHPLLSRPVPFKPLEFDVPRQATAKGELHLKWRREAGLGAAGRGLQVAEVSLMRK